MSMSNFAHSNPFHILFGQRERPENVSLLNPASHILTSFVDSAESSDFYQGLKNTCSLSTDYLQYMDTVKGNGGINSIALNVKPASHYFGQNLYDKIKVLSGFIY